MRRLFVLWCLVASVMVMASPPPAAAAQVGGGGCAATMTIEVPAEKASTLAWLFLEPGDSIEMTATSTLGLRDGYSDWNYEAALWRYDVGGFPGTHITDDRNFVGGWADPPAPKEETVTLRNSNTTALVVLELSYGYYRTELEQDAETELSNFEIVHADGSRSAACINPFDPGERPERVCFSETIMTVSDTGVVRSEPFELPPGEWITMKMLDERLLRAVDGEFQVIGTSGDWSYRGALVEPGAAFSWTWGSDIAPIDRDAEVSQLVWSRPAYLDGRIQLRNDSNVSTVQVALQPNYVRTGDRNNPGRAFSSVLYSLVDGKPFCMRPNVSTPGWDNAPTCAADGTSQIRATITNPSDSDETYRIVIIDTASGNHLLDAAPTTVEAGGAAYLTLSGIPDGRWAATVFQGTEELTPSATFTFDNFQTCVADRDPDITWDTNWTCASNGDASMGVTVRNNRSVAATYQIEVLDPSGAVIATSSSVSISAKSEDRLTVGGLSSGAMWSRVLENGVPMAPSRPFEVGTCAPGAGTGSATISAGDCDSGTLTVEVTNDLFYTQTVTVRVETPGGSFVDGGSWSLDAGDTETFTITGLPVGTFAVEVRLDDQVVANDPAVEFVRCPVEPVTGLGVRYETGWGTSEGPHLEATWEAGPGQQEARWFYDMTAPEIEAANFEGEFAVETVAGNRATIEPDEPGLTRKRWCVAVRTVGSNETSTWSGPACVFTLKCSTQLVTVMLGRGEAPTEEDDSILGTVGADSIDALGGHDFVCARDGNDNIVGGDGDDSIWASFGDDVVHGGPGEDRLYGSSGNDELHGGADNDYVNGNSGDDVLHGDDGDDTVLGYTGDDQLFGDGGNDYLGGHSHEDELHGGPGNDTLYGHGDADLMFGDDGDDNLYGSWGADVMFGGAGIDRLEAGHDNDILYGGPGDDELYGQTHDDVLFGGIGFDYGNGGSGSDGCSEIEDVFRCPVSDALNTCEVNAQGVIECAPDTFTLSNECGSPTLVLLVHKNDAMTGTTFDVAITSLGAPVTDTTIDVTIGSSNGLQVDVPDGIYSATVLNDEGEALDGPLAIGVSNAECHIPPWLTEYTPAEVLMTPERVQWLQNFRDDLFLRPHERLFAELLGQDDNEYFIEVTNGPDGPKLVSVELWLSYLYTSGPVVRCPLSLNSCDDITERVLGFEFVTAVEYVQLPTGRWRIEWPNDTISFGDDAKVAQIKYIYGDRLNAGFSDDIVHDYVANEYWDTWEHFEPRTLLGDIHFALDILGMVPVGGEVFDGINAVIYIAEGDVRNAVLSGAGMVPFGGSAATGTRAANRVRGVVEESWEAADGTIGHVIRRADGTVVVGAELVDGTVTFISKNGRDLVNDVVEMDIAVTRHIAHLGDHLDLPGPVISTIGVRQADGSYIDLFAEPTQNLVNGAGNVIVAGSGHAGVARLVDDGIVREFSDGAGNRFVEITDIDEYVATIDDLFLGASPSGRGLTDELNLAIREHIGDGSAVPVHIPGHAGGRFPGTHAEIVAVNEALHEGIPMSEIAVSSVWTNVMAGSPRVPGEAAFTCPNCRGILEATDSTVLTNFPTP